MSSKNPDHECSTELPDALAAAISSQNRNFWGVCAVRRPRRLARLCYLINDTVTIGNAPFADVQVPCLSPIHAVIRRNPVDGSLGVANASAAPAPPIIVESNGFRVALQPVETVGFPSSGTLQIPESSTPSSSEEDLLLEIYSPPHRGLVVPSPVSGQVDARVFAHLCNPQVPLKDMLTCQVCHELLFDAVTVSPCCHHFCAPCLSQWLDSDNANAHSCPVCRVILSAATPDPLIRSISSAYAQVEPAHARNSDEIRQMQQVDTSSIARVGERRRHAGEDEDESDDEMSFDEEMPSWDGHGGGFDSSGLIRGPDAFALDIHAPFLPPSFRGQNGNEPMRRTLQRWSEMFSVEVDDLAQLDEIAVSTYLSDVWMAYIASFVACKLSDKVLYIHLPDCGLGQAAAPLLGEALCLHFDRVAQGRHVGPSSVDDIQDEVESRGVRELYVDSNFLRDSGCLALLCAPLQHPACTLRAISISSVGLHDVGFRTLAASLALNSTVTELNIRHNPLGDDSIELLSDIMKGERCAFSCLELGSNAFGSRGLAALGRSLEYATSLKTLAISSVCSDGEGADCGCWEAWAAGLRMNRTLKHIILHSCSLSAESCAILCGGLEVNSTLTRLVLDYNFIGDDGCESLSRVMYASAMKRVPNRDDAPSESQSWGLQELSVVANGVGERGGALLLRMLVAGGCKLLLDGLGWKIASELEALWPIQLDDPNFVELRAADTVLSMTLELVAASLGQQRAAIGEALPVLPDIPCVNNLSTAAFAFAISSHIPTDRAPLVSLLAFVVPSTAARAAHAAGSATLTPDAIMAMRSNDIAVIATQRAHILSADCIQAVSELEFSCRTWRKDWQRHTLSQTFANSDYFQAHPAHRDKIIDALVAMRAEAETAATAAGGGTPLPPAFGTMPPVPQSSDFLHTEALRQELLQRLPGFAFDCDRSTVMSHLQRDVALYERFAEQFKSLVEQRDHEAAQRLVLESGSNSLDNCVLRISSALLRLGAPSSENVFYGLPLSVTSCRNGSAESVKYFNRNPLAIDHWSIVHHDLDNSNQRIWVSWRQDAAYLFVNGMESSADCDGFSSSVSALRNAFELVSSSERECTTLHSENSAPLIDVIAACRVDWPGPDSVIGNRIRQEAAKDVVLVALSHNEVCSQIMVNPNPLQWGRAAASITFDLGCMRPPETGTWTCSHGHPLWPVLLMPNERYVGGWACDVCDSHLQFFCPVPVLHCEICKFDVCGLCQAKHTPVEALEIVAAHDDSGWHDVEEEDDDIFGGNGDGGEGESDIDDSSSDPLSSSGIEDSSEGNDAGDINEESSGGGDSDGHSGQGSQGISGQVSYEVFVDASFNQLGTSVRRALHAAPMFSRCVRVFELSSVNLSREAPSLQ